MRHYLKILIVALFIISLFFIIVDCKNEDQLTSIHKVKDSRLSKTNNTPGQMGGAIQGKPLAPPAAVTTIAGVPLEFQHRYADGIGAAARFNMPEGITTDGTNLYVTDFDKHNIRKIVIATGVVTTVAGRAKHEGFADGIGAAARFKMPYGITTDGTNLYVAENMFAGTIRKIVIATGAVTTVAGNPNESGYAGGIGTTASFCDPRGITTDGINLYVADSQNYTIRKIVIATGAVTTIAGRAKNYDIPSPRQQPDGPITSASFSGPQGITTDGISLYVTDGGGNEVIRKIQ